jgi:hypothetical protein
VAKIDYRMFLARLDETNEEYYVDELMDVAKNDFNLDYDHQLSIQLPDDKSELGGNLYIETDDETGEEKVRYKIRGVSYGIDRFRYILKNLDCNLEDEGEVVILIREKGRSPIIAANDIAVTHENQPVIIDVAANDMLNEPGFPGNYSLQLKAPPINSNSQVVVEDHNGRLVFRYIPADGFRGRDIFSYDIIHSGMRASGYVTVLVIPCCEGGIASEKGAIFGMVYEITVTGATGALTGGKVELLQGDLLIATQTTLKGQYRFEDVQPGTYQMGFHADGHESEFLDNVTVIAGQETQAETVYLQEFGGESNFVPPTGMTMLSDNLMEFRPSYSREDAENLVKDYMNDRFALNRATAVNIVSIPDYSTRKSVQDGMIFIDSFADHSRGLDQYFDDYKNVTNQLIRDYAKVPDPEKGGFRNMIKATTYAMLDRLAMESPSGMDRQSMKIISGARDKMAEAGINLKGIRNGWKGKQLKENLEVTMVNEVNSIFK